MPALCGLILSLFPSAFSKQATLPHSGKLPAVTHVFFLQTACEMSSCRCIVAGTVSANKSNVYYSYALSFLAMLPLLVIYFAWFVWSVISFLLRKCFIGRDEKCRRALTEKNAAINANIDTLHSSTGQHQTTLFSWKRGPISNGRRQQLITAPQKGNILKPNKNSLFQNLGAMLPVDINRLHFSSWSTSKIAALFIMPV